MGRRGGNRARNLFSLYRLCLSRARRRDVLASLRTLLQDVSFASVRQVLAYLSLSLSLEELVTCCLSPVCLSLARRARNLLCLAYFSRLSLSLSLSKGS